jgi:hypothetical protein
MYAGGITQPSAIAVSRPRVTVNGKYNLNNQDKGIGAPDFCMASDCAWPGAIKKQSRRLDDERIARFSQ